MKDYPFVKCMHPKKVRNPYTGESILALCGKCSACLLHKSDVYTLKCNLESKSNKYCMFVTLTYRWNTIPLLRPSSFTKYHFNKDNVHFRDSISFYDTTPRFAKYAKARYGIKVCETDSFAKDMRMIQEKCCNKQIPYLNKKDLQNFMKRFRTNLKQYSNEKVRYFACGEYGPQHFRPHFHLLLWFNNESTLRNFAKVLRQSWKLGFVNFSLAEADCKRYVAGYVNSNCVLPKIFTSIQTKPFLVHSAYLGEKVFQCAKEEVYKMPQKDFIQRCILLNGTTTNVFLWRSLENIYYPKCRAFTTSTAQELSFSYRAYEIASEWTQETSPYKQAKFIVEYIYEHWMFGKSLHRVEHFVPLYDKLLEYFFSGFRFSTKKVCRCDKDVFEQIFRSIYFDLRISRQFVVFCCDNNPKNYNTMLHRIINYYKDKDYESLKNQITNKITILESDFADCEELFYDNINLSSNYEDYSLPYLFGIDSEKRAMNAIKHKELNDANNIFDNK